MTYAGRHRKTSSLKIAQRRAAMTALVAGAVAAGGVAGGGVAGAAPGAPSTTGGGTVDGVVPAGGVAQYVPADAQAGVAAGAETLVNIPGMPSVVGDVLGPIIPPSASAALAEAVVKPAEGTLTSGFGPRWGTMHNGIDIANVQNTPIHAIMSGTVIDAGPASGYGQWIRIRHDDGATTVYGHMETLAVAVGERISAGQYIAGMGNRGQSTGTHLHFEIHPSGSGPIDPQPWFAERGIHF